MISSGIQEGTYYLVTTDWLYDHPLIIGLGRGNKCGSGWSRAKTTSFRMNVNNYTIALQRRWGTRNSRSDNPPTQHSHPKLQNGFQYPPPQFHRPYEHKRTNNTKIMPVGAPCRHTMTTCQLVAFGRRLCHRRAEWVECPPPPPSPPPAGTVSCRM